ncbi:MAG: hypothetical protein R3A52_17485 [Polyangiales bacterium]
MLEPTAFEGFARPDASGVWGADLLQRGAWTLTRRLPTARAGAVACFSGNLFERAYDCQSATFTAPDRSSRVGGFVGQRGALGFAAVAPWSLDDDPTRDLRARRAALTARADALAPGGALAGAYTVGVATLDGDLGATPPAAIGARGVEAPIAAESVEVAPTERGAQRRPDGVVLPDGSAFVVWEDSRDGCGLFYGARSDGPFAVGFRNAAPVIAHGREPRAPRVVSGARSQVFAAWQERAGEVSTVRFARSVNGGRAFEAPRGFGDGVTAQWWPSVAVDDATATVLVAWAERAGAASVVRVARSADAGASFGAAETVEAAQGPGEPDPRVATPAIAAGGGRALVAWVERRPEGWVLLASEADARGGAWSEPARVDDGGDGAAMSDPAVLRLPGATGEWRLAWTDHRAGVAFADVRATTLRVGAVALSVRVASADPDLSPRWAPSFAWRADRAALAWSDLASGRAHPAVAFVTGGDGWSDPRSLDDGPADAQQGDPRLMAGGVDRPQAVTALFSDDRSGLARARALTLP